MAELGSSPGLSDPEVSVLPSHDVRSERGRGHPGNISNSLFLESPLRSRVPGWMDQVMVPSDQSQVLRSTKRRAVKGRSGCRWAEAQGGGREDLPGTWKEGRMVWQGGETRW